MADSFEQRLALFSSPGVSRHFTGIRRGIERETLRVRPDGCLSDQPHPRALGSSLMHPRITTDFSEAQLELVTPTATDGESLLAHLKMIQAAACRGVEGEYLWAASMPAQLGQEEEISIARYGTSHRGRMKTLYREGLGHRYGRHMQTICGMHYNFSLPDAFWDDYLLPAADTPSDAYFALVRNCRRWAWLLTYLFGASPVVSPDFIGGRPHTLQTLPSGDLGLPWATCLRMGELGYCSSAQSTFPVLGNSLDEYVCALHQAILRSWPAYRALGSGADSASRQLGGGLLQIENEYYSVIRPKRSSLQGEVPLRALTEHGVEYVELRCLDIDPEQPLGISVCETRFLDSFLLYCLLADSPLRDAQDEKRDQDNLQRIVEEGRRAGLKLDDGGRVRPREEWAAEVLAGVAAVARTLDAAQGGDAFTAACTAQQRKVQDVTLTPSARLMKALEDTGESFRHHILARSRSYTEAMMTAADEHAEQFQAMAQTSLEEQQRLEAEETGSFEEYRDNYYRQYHALPQHPVSGAVKQRRTRRISSRVVHWAMALGTAALLAFAVYLEKVQGLEPCALCVTQRAFFVLVGAAALLAAVHNPVTVWLRVYAVLILLPSLAGAAVAGRQLWLQQLPPEEVLACGPGLGYLLKDLPLSELVTVLFQGDGHCAEIAWTFLGLSIPGWSLLAFTLLAALAAWQAAGKEIILR